MSEDNVAFVICSIEVRHPSSACFLTTLLTPENILQDIPYSNVLHKLEAPSRIRIPNSRMDGLLSPFVNRQDMVYFAHQS